MANEMEIVVTSSLKFRVGGHEREVTEIAAHFRESRAEGLLTLVRKPTLRTRSQSAAYWYDYASAFMRSLCAFSDTDPLHVPIDEVALTGHADSIPPLEGAENVSREFLFELWEELESYIREIINGGSVRKFIAENFAGWENVGKIHFHLAENKKNNGQPFAFLSTYSVRIPGKARLQYRPLGIALKESAKKNDRKHLEQLLWPIHKASKTSSFINDVLKSQSIYMPLYLDPTEAFRFIQDIPSCEEAGIVCKVPGWWQKGRPPRAKVSVRVGTKKKSQVGFDQLLDFDVGVSIGGENLTKAQLMKLLEAEGPLVQLGGKWIEVDKDRIEKMLSVWNEAVSAADGGSISFSEAMRMMAGFSMPGDTTDELDEMENARDWIEVVAGPAFEKLLQSVREPKGHHSKQIQNILNRHLKGNLRPYQESGLEWLKAVTTLQLGGCLADDMGLGKTIQVIAMLLVAKHQLKTNRPSLLVVPASLLGNWQSEIAKFAPDLKYRVLHSSAESAKNLKRPPKDLTQLDFVITTYGMVLRSDWLQKKDWRTVIADEAQAIKNAKTKQSKALRSLKASSKIAMTGTPVENSLGDLWSIFDFACPGLLGTEVKFKKAVSSMSGTSRKGEADYSPLRRLISPYILRRKKTDKSIISDLPDKIEMIAECYLTKKQATLYQKEVLRLREALEEADGIQRKGLVLSSLMKFKQICNHPSQYLSNDSYLPAHSGKFAKLKDLIETMATRQEKLLVFTQFRELTDILAHYLGECFGREGLIIHGGTAVKKRQALVEEFQDPSGPPFFVASLKAGGTGLNLTEANHVIHFDRWWNPAVENQATDRAFRIGQKNNVLVHKFVCKGTIEEKIDAMISEKRELADAVVEGGKEVKLTELSNEELLSLVSLDVHALGGTD